jgi:hypothetical protein
MNQYLNESNQNMLWKVINNAPQVIQYFRQFPPGTKEQWFQSIIKNTYYQFTGSSLSLKELNKRTLDMMLQSIEEPPASKAPATKTTATKATTSNSYLQSYNQSVSIPQSASIPQSVSIPQPSFDPNKMVKPREQILSEQFEIRKKEYESMVNKPVPKPEFTNAIKDEVINDIGSAVEEYMKQRNADIPAYSPVKTSEEITLNVEELPEPKKRVQWGDNSERTFDNQQPVIDYAEKIKALETHVQQLDAIIADLVGQVKALGQVLRQSP